MKNVFILAMCLLSNKCFYAQTVTDNDPKVSLKLACRSQDIKHDLMFILGVTNHSNEQIELQKDLLAVPKTSNQETRVVLYEVFFCGVSDTTDITSLKRVHVDKFISSPIKKINVEAGDSYYFNPFMDSQQLNIYFYKKGIYKMRFILKKEASAILDSDIHSEWIYIKW